MARARRGADPGAAAGRRLTFFARNTYSFLLVVADVEREDDDVPGDVGREARESLRGEFRGERLAMGLLVGREAAGRGDLAQVRGAALVYPVVVTVSYIVGVRRNRRTTIETTCDTCVYTALSLIQLIPTRPSTSPQRRKRFMAQRRRRRGGESKTLQEICKTPQVVGFSPNSKRFAELEIVRMLPAVTLQATRSPTKRVGAKKSPQKKT